MTTVVAPPPAHAGLTLPRRALRAAGATAAVWTATVCALTLMHYVQHRAADPLNSPRLVELRERYSNGLGNPETQAAIRELDLRVRRQYFTSLYRFHSGGLLALCGAVFSVAAFVMAGALEPIRPRIDAKPTDEAVWRNIERARAWVIGAALIMAAAAAVLVLTTPTCLPHGRAVTAEPTVETNATGADASTRP